MVYHLVYNKKFIHIWPYVFYKHMVESYTMFIGRIPPRGVRWESGILRPMVASIMVTRPPIRMGPWVTRAILSRLVSIKVASLTGLD